jgi:hypothetical protein
VAWDAGTGKIHAQIQLPGLVWSVPQPWGCYLCVMLEDGVCWIDPDRLLIANHWSSGTDYCRELAMGNVFTLHHSG